MCRRAVQIRHSILIPIPLLMICVYGTNVYIIIYYYGSVV
jgi:hypothetical protein